MNYIMIGGGGIVYLKEDPYAVSPLPPPPFQTETVHDSPKSASAAFGISKYQTSLIVSLITRFK